MGRGHLVACPRPFTHAEQNALALHERGLLSSYVTGFTWPRSGPWHAVARTLGGRAGGALARRAVPSLPPSIVDSMPLIDLGRTFASAARTRRLEDWLWERDDHRFSAAVARRVTSACAAVHGYEHSSLEMFDAARRIGVPAILHLSSVHPQFHDEVLGREYERYPNLKDVGWQLREKRAPRDARRLEEYAGADLLVSSSSFVTRTLVARGIESERIATVLLGTGAIDPGAGSYRRSGPLRVLFAGKVAVHKGAHLLLEAWSEVAPADGTLTLAGRCALPDASIARAGVEPLGPVPQPRLFALMADSDVLVFPTLCDSFGLVVLEALAHRLPVLTTRNAGAADLVSEGVNGWVIDAGDVTSIADRLSWCSRHLEALRAMRRARDRAWPPLRTWSMFRADLRAALSARGFI